MDIPAQIAGRWVLAIARAKKPEPLASIILDQKIVADGGGLFLAPPPFAKNSLRPIGVLHPVPNAPPGEMSRRVIGQKRHCVDRLGRRQKAAWPWPMFWPDGIYRRCKGCKDLYRAFGQIALGGRCPVEVCYAWAIDERIDKGREIGFWVSAKIATLAGSKWLGERGGKHHFFDAKLRINNFELLAQEPCQPGGVAQRLGRPGADRFNAPIDPVKEQIEAARPKTSALQRFAKQFHKLCRVAGTCLRCADRVGTGLVHMKEFW